MSRSGWRAAVTVEPDPHGLTDDWVVLLPRPDAPRGGLAERMRREVQVLVGLAERGVPFRLPEVLAAWDEGNLSVLVERFVPGIPLDLRTGRQGSVRPWEVVARVAAAVHRVPIAVGGYPTRLAHAKAALRSLEHVGGELAERAWAWAADHMPPDEPTVLIHGDLLGQNILLGLDAPPGVIDWEYTQQGDPAWDFAIVTRGVSRPFQVSHGLDRLLEAYAAESSIDVRREHVHLYELSLLGEDGEHDHDGRAHARLRALLERLKA
jgi:aminoglycoside phosphotransferase (APT) family kinase protein